MSTIPIDEPSERRDVLADDDEMMTCDDIAETPIFVDKSTIHQYNGRNESANVSTMK